MADEPGLVSETPSVTTVALLVTAPEESAVKDAVVPLVEDSKLGNIIRDLYKGARTAQPIGTGSTADAIRYETETGLPVGGTFHTAKGQQYLRALENWLSKRGTTATPRDGMVARSVLDDLRDALGIKK